MRIVFITSLLAFFAIAPMVASLTGCIPAPAAADVGESPETNIVAKEVAVSYADELQLLTDKPQPSRAENSKACARATIIQTEETHGPHANYDLKIYSDATAKEAINDGTYPFPLNAIIVKEKRKDGKVIGVGGMIKRADDYDPDNGNWEYFYFEDMTELSDFEAGKIASCVDCHGPKTKTDAVIGNWRSD